MLGSVLVASREGLTIDIGRAVEAVRIIPAQDKTEIERIKSLSSYYYTSDKINENSEDYYVLAQELLLESDYPNSQNRLIISVNLDRTKEEIEEEIKNLLKIHMHNREKRKRLTKWKYYIVAYDIKNENGNISYDKIADNLQRLFPDADHLLMPGMLRTIIKTPCTSSMEAIRNT